MSKAGLPIYRISERRSMSTSRAGRGANERDEQGSRIGFRGSSALIGY